MVTVYVIRNGLSGKIYIGQTEDLEKRLARHNGFLKNKSTSYTAKQKGFWELVYTEQYATRQEAMRRERELKSFRGREFIKSKIGVI